MAINYQSLSDCRSLVKTKARLKDTVDSEIDTMLSDTQGKTPAPDLAITFRPYWVASVLLDQKLSQVEKADGAEFRDLWKNVLALRNYQFMLDKNLELTVPENTSESYILGSSGRRKSKSVKIVRSVYG